MPKIQIPTPLRQYAGKQPAVEVKAGTIGDALSDLVAQHPDLRRHLYTDDGKLRAFVNVTSTTRTSATCRRKPRRSRTVIVFR